MNVHYICLHKKANKANKAELTLALKSREDITRNREQVCHSEPHKQVREGVPYFLVKEKLKNTLPSGSGLELQDLWQHVISEHETKYSYHRKGQTSMKTYCPSKGWQRVAPEVDLRERTFASAMRIRQNSLWL